jgi:uncharacterized protein YkwD
MRHLPATFLLIVFLVFFIVSTASLSQSEIIKPQAQFHPRASHPATAYLPGALDLRSRHLAVLGWDTEEITEDQIISFVNKERQKAGSPTLTKNRKLTEAAILRTDTILKRQNFSHQDPYDHIQLDTILPRVKYLFSYASENIGLAQDSASGIVNGFMSSPSHRQNLLDKNLQETGVGIKKGIFKGNYVVIVVQLFGSPAKEEVYLGYSKSDISTVNSLITGVEGELKRTEGLLAQNPDSAYYKGWLVLLSQQKERLSEVYSRMLTGQPYQKLHYDLIAAYNSTWATAPQ